MVRLQVPPPALRVVRVPVGPRGEQGAPGVNGSGVFTGIQTNAAGFTINAGQPVKISGSGAVLARADAIGNVCMGIAQAQAANGSPLTIQFGGILSLSDWSIPLGAPSLLTPGAPYYLSLSAGGILTTIAPQGTGQIFQYLGTAISTTDLFIQIQQPPIVA